MRMPRMEKKRFLEELETMKSWHYWIGESNGYGSDGCIYALSCEGLTAYGSLSSGDITKALSSPLSEDDILAAYDCIERGAEDECDDEITDMVKQECEAGVEYYKLDLGNEYKYGSLKELLDEVVDIKSEYYKPDEIPWDEMDEDELEYWAGVLERIKEGHMSCYEI